MKPIAELKTDFIDDEDIQYLDAYFTEDDNEEGKTVAVVDRYSGKAIFFDNAYRTDKLVQEAIKEIQADIFDCNMLRIREMKTIWKLKITFFDVIHSGSDKLKEYYNGLDNDHKRAFIDQHAKAIENGCSYGFPTGDVMSDIASNLECDTL